MSQKFYQVGGSLSANASSYIKREVDDKLYNYIKEGKYCYVLNARQVGKSSLRVYTSQRLEKDGFSCINIDLTSIGSEDITIDEWYFSFVLHIIEQLELDEDRFVEWWDNNSKLTVVNRFSKIFDKLILENNSKKIVVFIDEIDYILGIRQDFSTDDFFAVIRSFYNLRSEDERYNQLSFALFGVATPEELMRDSTRTPFNVAYQVYIKPFKLSESLSLIEGLENQKVDGWNILNRVFTFTGGIPYLTQKLLEYISEHPISSLDDIDRYVDTIFIKENFKETNLSNIQQRIIGNSQYNIKMLNIIDSLVSKKKVKSDDRDITQIYLKLSGLVKEEFGHLGFSNKIYEIIFNKKWIEESLDKIDRPFMKDLQRWIELDKVESALIKGEVLKEATKWATARDDLSVDENDFLRRSFQVEKENELKEEKKKAQSKQIKTLIFSLFVAIVIGIGLVYFYLESKDKEEEAKRYRNTSNTFAMTLKKREIESIKKSEKEIQYKKNKDKNDTVKLVIPDETKSKYPTLVKQIIESKSMNNSERNYWLQVLPVMTPDQVAELRDILETEIRKLKVIDEKYGKLENQAILKTIPINNKKIDNIEIQKLFDSLLTLKKYYKNPELYSNILNKIKSMKNRFPSKDKYFQLLTRFYIAIGEYAKIPKFVKPNILQYELDLDKAKFFERNKKYSVAIKKYNRLIKKYSTFSVEVYSILGNLYKNKKEYDKAIEAYKKAVEINPKYDKAYNNMGIAYYNKKEYDNAIEAYKKAVEINPKKDEAYYNMGIAYYNKKEYDNAIEAYKKAVEINPKDDGAYNNMGIAYGHLEKFDKAIAYYTKALQINPNQSVAYSNLFELQLTQNQPFDQTLETEYLKRFSNKKEIFIHYEMLKILQAIANHQEANVEEWKQKYRDVELGWSFDELDTWVAKMNEGEVKERLVEALGVFRGHKRD